LYGYPETLQTLMAHGIHVVPLLEVFLVIIIDISCDHSMYKYMYMKCVLCAVKMLQRYMK